MRICGIEINFCRGKKSDKKSVNAFDGKNRLVLNKIITPVATEQKEQFIIELKDAEKSTMVSKVGAGLPDITPYADLHQTKTTWHRYPLRSLQQYKENDVPARQDMHKALSQRNNESKRISAKR